MRTVVSNKVLNKILSVALVDVDADTTCIDAVIGEYHLYAYIENETMLDEYELADCSFMWLTEIVSLTDEQEDIIKNHLVNELNKQNIEEDACYDREEELAFLNSDR